MTKSLTSSLLLCSLLLISISSFSQNSANDTSLLIAATKSATLLYKRSIGDQANLYNGSEYRGFISNENTEGFPYFQTDDWTDGTVYYDSGLYLNVPLMYETVTDNLILDHPYGHFKIQLINQKILYFDIYGHHFVRLQKSASDSTVTTGFYDVMYDGGIKVYVKHHKQIEQYIQASAVKINYVAKDKIFIYKDGKFHPVKSKSSVLKVLADRKKSLKRLMAENKANMTFDFKKDRENAIANIALLYDKTADSK